MYPKTADQLWTNLEPAVKTTASYRSWLDAKLPIDPVGLAYHGAECPMAVWLDAVIRSCYPGQHVDVSVSVGVWEEGDDSFFVTYEVKGDFNPRTRIPRLRFKDRFEMAPWMVGHMHDVDDLPVDGYNLLGRDEVIGALRAVDR